MGGADLPRSVLVATAVILAHAMLITLLLWKSIGSASTRHADRFTYIPISLTSYLVESKRQEAAQEQDWVPHPPQLVTPKFEPAVSEPLTGFPIEPPTFSAPQPLLAHDQSLLASSRTSHLADSGVLGPTIVNVEILPNGMTGSVELSVSSGRSDFDESVIRFVKQILWQPGRYRGIPIPMTIQIAIDARAIEA